MDMNKKGSWPTVSRPHETIYSLVNAFDSLVLEDHELGDIGELRDEIREALENGHNYIKIPAHWSKSGKEVALHFTNTVLDA